MTTDPVLVLASASPRRKELLEQLGYRFSVIATDVEEVKKEQESAAEYVQRLAQDKALAGLALSNENAVALGSDTVVVIDGQVLEKPQDYADSKRMLNQLSGAKHQVMTGVSVVSGKMQKTIIVITDVWFKSLNEKEIEQYWLSGEPCDKAGSYGIQGLGGRFVTRIEGSFHSVVGLPLFETDQLLHEFL